MASPIFQWIGGKQRIVSELMSYVPENYSCYHEPFAGGAAMFFAMEPERAVLSDMNPYLINVYRVVRDHSEDYYAELVKLASGHCKEQYYRTVNTLHVEADDIKRAVMTVYLIQSSYNGKFGLDSKGVFTPSFKARRCSIADWDTVSAASCVLRNAELEVCPFDRHAPRCGDLYYLDPPYQGIPIDTGAYAIRADAEVQRRVANYAKQIDRVGGFFIASNFDTKEVREMYAGYEMSTATMYSSFPHGTKGAPPPDIIITNCTRTAGT